MRSWPGRRPPYYLFLIAIGGMLSVLIVYKLAILRWHPADVFGETMMLVYYAYAVPLSLKIGRGFYEDGIWADAGFIPYSRIGGLTWPRSPLPSSPEAIITPVPSPQTGQRTAGVSTPTGSWATGRARTVRAPRA